MNVWHSIKLGTFSSLSFPGSVVTFSRPSSNSLLVQYTRCVFSGLMNSSLKFSFPRFEAVNLIIVTLSASDVNTVRWYFTPPII